MDPALYNAIFKGDPGIPVEHATRTSAFTEHGKDQKPKTESQTVNTPVEQKEPAKLKVSMKIPVNEFEFFRFGISQWNGKAKALFEQFISALNEYLGHPKTFAIDVEAWIEDGHGPMCMLTVSDGMTYDQIDLAELDFKASVEGLKQNLLPKFTQAVTSNQLYAQARKLASQFIAFEYLPDFVLNMLQKYNPTLAA